MPSLVSFQVLLSFRGLDVTSFPCPVFRLLVPFPSSRKNYMIESPSIQYYKNDTNLLIIAAVWLQFRLIGCVC